MQNVMQTVRSCRQIRWTELVFASNSPAQGARSLHDLEIRKIRKRGVALPREPVPLSEEVRKECVWPDYPKHGMEGRDCGMPGMLGVWVQFLFDA